MFSGKFWHVKNNPSKNINKLNAERWRVLVRWYFRKMLWNVVHLCIFLYDLNKTFYILILFVDIGFGQSTLTTYWPMCLILNIFFPWTFHDKTFFVEKLVYIWHAPASCFIQPNFLSIRLRNENIFLRKSVIRSVTCLFSRFLPSLFSPNTFFIPPPGPSNIAYLSKVGFHWVKPNFSCMTAFKKNVQCFFDQ